MIGPFRLNGLRDIYASPVAADGKIFVTSREGATFVISQAEFPRLISANYLDDSFSASMALAGDEIFLRGENYIYCIGKPRDEMKAKPDDQK